jgi:hypothetical protein
MIRSEGDAFAASAAASAASAVPKVIASVAAKNAPVPIMDLADVGIPIAARTRRIILSSPAAGPALAGVQSVL